MTKDGSYYVEMPTPNEWRSWLTKREDKQIFGLEALAVVLGLESFRELLKGKNVTIYTDNKAVEGDLTRGSSKQSDHNEMIHLIWRRFVCDKIGAWVERVPTDDNIADGPTREWLEAIVRMGSVKCEAVLHNGGCL